MGSRLLIPVIMCGGAGTRLWPVSRESMPKQFVPLVETRSTFQQVLGRIGDATVFERPIVITSSDFRFIAAEQMRACAIAGDIVLEPMRRDSAMAVGVAAALAAARDPASTVIVLAADHVVHDPDAFTRACRDAMAAAAAGRIVTFGIPPTFPATNYGYIRPGATLDGGTAFAVDAFVEKPDAATAGRYIADRYLWNSGNFLFRADVMLGELMRFEPDIAKAAQAAVAGITKDLDFLRLPAEAFAQRRKNPSITRSWNAPRAPPWCRSIAAGRTSAAGARSGTRSATTPTAMPPRAPSSFSTAATASRIPTPRSSPRWSASTIWSWWQRRTPCW